MGDCQECGTGYQLLLGTVFPMGDGNTLGLEVLTMNMLKATKLLAFKALTFMLWESTVVINNNNKNTNV